MAVRIVTFVSLLGLVISLGYFTYAQLRPVDSCDICHRPIHEETAYLVQLDDGSSYRACCPRCGLRFRAERADATSAEVTDFDTGERIHAHRALFVENSSVNLCQSKMLEQDRSGVQYRIAWDRCLPSLIAFKDREGAESFRRDYGGAIKTYGELLEEEL